MEPRISLITLGVADLDRAVRFYQDGLGLPLREGFEGVAFFMTKGTWLALYPWDELAADATVPAEGSGFRGFTLAHNLHSKEEVDALLAHVQTVGATLVKPAQEAEWGGYTGYFADPDGYLWEVAWNPFFWIE
ncbi:MAG: VOC family protein [Chloroflexota bacterium]|jgi:catechol 2,3-dioxygenase-like lactoylglutathione lyase family enzyme